MKHIICFDEPRNTAHWCKIITRMPVHQKIKMSPKSAKSKCTALMELFNPIQDFDNISVH